MSKKLEKFPYDQLPPLWRNSVAITKRPNTYWFEEIRTNNLFEAWLKELHNHHGADLLPMQWASIYVGVSRTAVLEKAKRGELFVFSYVVSERDEKSSRYLFRLKKQTKLRYDYVLISELDKWKDHLSAIAD